MVVVGGNSIDTAALAGEYPANSVERLVLGQMADSAKAYSYSSLSHLKFELTLRAATVDAARELNRSGFSFADFRKSRCNAEYWDRTENGGFRLKQGVSPSQAILDIYKNGGKYASECATAMVIVLYKALLDVFGKEAFDKAFSSIYLMNWHSIAPPLQEIGLPENVKELLIGDRAYFINPDVDPQTPEWQGENVIVLPDRRYYGHGIGIASADRIIASLNRNRKKDSTKSAYLMDSAARPDYKRLYQLYQRLTPAPAPSAASSGAVGEMASAAAVF